MNDGSANDPAYVLVVEDDAAIRHLLAAIIQGMGLQARLAATGNQALALATEEPPALVVLDLGLPGLYGTSVGVILRKSLPKLPIIIVSALPKDAVVQDAWNFGANAYFTKPFDTAELASAIQRLLPRSIPT
ncbi:MAG TPA: response regulator transcription factor [Chloroflexota bacterium]